MPGESPLRTTSQPTEPTLPIIGIVGPTASGKTRLSLQVAARLRDQAGMDGVGIVNADAFQLYLGMDIGTAKPRPAERRGIPHHQFDVLDIGDEASVAVYQTRARADIAAIRQRGAVPLMVGGSGLYVRAALDALDIPPTDPAVRARLEDDLARSGRTRLWERLRAQDPSAASAIDPRNGRRLVRALEVIQLTGGPFAAAMPERRFLTPTVLVGLHVARPELDRRIEERTHLMWRQGFLDEVGDLLARGLDKAPTASRAVGYREAMGQLAGRLTQADALVQTVTATRRLARRQLSWFRADPRITWLDADHPDLAGLVVDLAIHPAHRRGRMGR
ncbi:MAG TPA: tRNA (adenosine(37)-N6)-dimethylallyltransferase MiaA [Dermatophilaceae bacterium]|nr:tRNA (adenosine(37)-N6)-dimethylallyltransferase MiaA [Dermatophilaceae bacterium]